MARLAWQAGIEGFVCSPAEVSRLRKELGANAVLVTPGIRPSGPSGDDQKRIATPAQAIAEGSSLLVVGRPIRDADDPAAAARAIVGEITSELQKREH